MMTLRWKRALAAALLLAVSATVLPGCWDRREINSLFILTGISVDVSDVPGDISVMAQVADIKRGEVGSGEANAGSSRETIEMKAAGDSLLECLTEMNRNSNRKLLFQHNQIRLYGVELAEQGLKKHLDMVMRDQKARLEVPLAVVDGRGEEALTANLSQAPISGIFLGDMFRDLSEVSEKYRVRLIDFVHNLLDDAAAPVLPIIRVTGEEGRREIKLAGMAVFRGDRMIGRLSNDEAMGYVWSFGDVKRSTVEVSEGEDRAVLRINKLDCKRKVALLPDGGVRISLKVNAVVETGEIYGFKEKKPPELLEHLQYLAQEKIKDQITSCFMTARDLNADIFGFCTMVYKKYPRQWNTLKDRWDEVYPNIDLDVQAKVRIPGMGQIGQSLEMEENMK